MNLKSSFLLVQMHFFTFSLILLEPQLTVFVLNQENCCICPFSPNDSPVSFVHTFPYTGASETEFEKLGNFLPRLYAAPWFPAGELQLVNKYQTDGLAKAKRNSQCISLTSRRYPLLEMLAPDYLRHKNGPFSTLFSSSHQPRDYLLSS